MQNSKLDLVFPWVVQQADLVADSRDRRLWYNHLKEFPSE